MGIFHYAGFLSYAHADETQATRLHKALERYHVPKGLKGKAKMGSLSPIFRDSEELSAHHSLPEKIASAVDGSHFLIVLCTPAAKASHWVNEEIRLFRERRGDPYIICALAQGTPETAFPPALTEGGREPLAATLTPGSFNQGVTQIAAAMLGVGLDDLVQRAARRKTRRLQIGMASSLALTVFMGGATYLAYDARNTAEDSRLLAEASQARAETSRGQAEDLVQFMVTDLRKELTAKERLSVLASIGERVTDYYDAQDTDHLPDSSLIRQAKAREVLGQVAIDMNDLEKAKKEIDAAANLSAKVLSNAPDSVDAIFAHAQSVYWQGHLAKKRQDIESARKAWIEYARLGQKLYDQDPKNPQWIMERGFGVNNLAILDRAERNYADALKRYADSISFFKQARSGAPESRAAEKELSNAMAGAATVSLYIGDADEARAYRQAQISLLTEIQAERPHDLKLSHNLSQARLQDYLIEVYVNPNACKQSRLREMFDEFSSLLAYDPDNMTWRTNALNKWGKAVSYCVPYLDRASARSLTQIFLDVLEPRDKATRLGYYIYDINMIHKILTRPENGPAPTLPEPLSLENILDWERLRQADYQAALGNKSAAQTLAESIQESSSLSPESLRYEAQRLRHLGRCAEASQLLKRRKMINLTPQKPFNICKA